MGFKLSLALGGLLLISLTSSTWYINKLQDQIAVLKGNQIALENSIEQQNESIKKNLAKQKQTQEQVNVLTAKNQEAQRQVNKLKNTFAKHLNLQFLAQETQISKSELKVGLHSLLPV
mgnify:CR=1 FL=1